MTGHPELERSGCGIKTIVHHRTLFYCDGPQVFEARDAVGGRYIAVLVGPDDRDARAHTMEQPSDRCLVARVAPGRLRLFRSGAIDLRSLLLELDPNEHYLATMDGGIHQPLQLDRLSTPLVDCGFLPAPGFLLHDEPRVPAPPRSSGEPGSVVGEATESVGGTIASVEVHDMERLEGHDDEASDLPPGAFVSQDFWTSPTLDDLAKAQNVGPLDVDALFGTWPGDDDDGFEETIDELRRSGLKKDVGS